MSLLAFEAVSVRHGDRIALDHVSFGVAAGEIVGLIGESGSGKSTAALAAIGLLPDAARMDGQIRIDGRETRDPAEAGMDALRGATMGMIFQEPMSALNPLMTIGAQVAEALRIDRRHGRRAAAAEAARLLERVGLADDRVPPTRYPHQLSGGQRQRAGIAIAIARDPMLLIADEPTTALDVTTQARVIALLVDLVRERGMGLLLVSHDLALVGGVADRIVVLKDGRIVEQGAAADVLAAPADRHTRLLLDRARHAPPRATAIDAEAAPVIEVAGLHRAYRGARRGWRRQPATIALDDVGFRIQPGETLGVVGESGSGKTTLLRTVLALDAPDRGIVRLGGVPIHAARGGQLRALRRDMQAVFQDPAGSFDPRQRVAAIVAEPLHLLDTPPDPIERRAKVLAALRRVGLDGDAADRYPHQFSGGQRQRIGIARALILEPRLVVLDEAVSALDVSVRADILDLLRRLSNELGLAYLFVSHDLGVMRAIADRLIVMKDGRIVEQGATADLLAAPQHAHTRALIAATPDLERVIAARAAG